MTKAKPKQDADARDFHLRRRNLAKKHIPYIYTPDSHSYMYSSHRSGLRQNKIDPHKRVYFQYQAFGTPGEIDASLPPASLTRCKHLRELLVVELRLRRYEFKSHRRPRKNRAQGSAFSWYTRRDSNSRSSGPKPDALSTKLRVRVQTQF